MIGWLRHAWRRCEVLRKGQRLLRAGCNAVSCRLPRPYPGTDRGRRQAKLQGKFHAAHENRGNVSLVFAVQSVGTGTVSRSLFMKNFDPLNPASR